MLGIKAGRLLRPLSFHPPKRKARPLKSSLVPATRIRQTNLHTQTGDYAAWLSQSA